MTKDDAAASIEFDIDSSFSGIMRGFADDESEGCTLTGTCIVHIRRPLKARRLVVWFEGRNKVNLRGNSPISSTEMVESRSLYYKSQQFIGDDGQLRHLEPGTYEYPFSFDLPSTLPASFRGKYGMIRYRLQATMFRPTFSSDIHSTREITLRRSLLGDDFTSSTAADMTETVEGANRHEQLLYSATATSMTHREGGLVRLNVNMNLGRPETQAVKSVTCALRETIRYRTTGERSLTYQPCSKIDEVYPLGWSTFHPSQSPDYNSEAPHNYNAVFRLCPRVNADNSTRLIDVKHSVIINMMVEEERRNQQQYPTITPASSCYESDNEDDDSDNHKLSVQQIEHAFTTAAAAVGTTTSTTLLSPPASQPTTPPVLSRSTSSSSISSIFSLRRTTNNGENNHGSRSNASSRRSSFSAITPSTPSSSRKEKSHHLTLCTLEIPVLVTSREHVWDGALPTPPAYNTAETPPSYFQSMEQLPAVPNYLPETTVETAS
ncbi:hypothetical protein BDC45DRAFT_506382 [Circinella umbellata]|nr:hypothetical protein BDC45DRAFT_506382 [Circinella umbellata]